jgi:SNF2 family DNA or RNA helicase
MSKPTAYAHQTTVLEASWDKPTYALLMDMGTGKTRVILDTAERLYARKLIRAVLVIAPNGVHHNWVLHEIPLHLDIPAIAVAWSSSRSKSKRFQEQMAQLFSSAPALKVLTMNVEALSSKTGRDVAAKFLDYFRGQTLFVVDESQKIKNVSAKRTKSLLALRLKAAYRRIMTGTPVTQSPLDVYSQFMFLDPAILGFTSFYAFKGYYAQTVKHRATDAAGHLYEYEEIVGYKHLEELTSRLRSRSFRVTKQECLDLPEKIYTRLIVELSAEQRRLYKELRQNMVMTIGSEVIPVPLMLTRLLRFQQITGGFIPAEDGVKTLPIAGSNPKLDALLSDIEDLPADESVIIWARFRAEIQRIVRALREAYGANSVGAYYGDTSAEDRAALIDAFQGKRTRFFVGNPQSAGLGLTLTAASTVYYFSNDFALENRSQSEDRCHRIGQRRSVVYKDIVCRGTIDERVLEVLKSKLDVADAIVGNPAALVDDPF